MEARSLRWVLANARALLASDDAWIGDEYGADRDGHWRPVGSRDAVRFSLWGAILRGGGSRACVGEARALFGALSPGLETKLRTQRLTYPESIALLDAALAVLPPGDDVGGGPIDAPSDAARANRSAEAE